MPHQGIRRIVIAGKPYETGLAAQCRNALRNVSSASGPVFRVRDIHHRHRCLGGNTAGGPGEVAVKHDIANH